jgi:hypothetical protein
MPASSSAQSPTPTAVHAREWRCTTGGRGGCIRRPCYSGARDKTTPAWRPATLTTL